MPKVHMLIAVPLAALALSGCQNGMIKPQSGDTATLASANESPEPLVHLTHSAAKAESTEQQPATKPPKDLWELTQRHLKLLDEAHNPRVDSQLQWYVDHDRYLSNASANATYYYYYVLHQVLKRGMPAEIALLPFVESGYNPHAVSASNAAGVWQFMPGTAELFKLRNNWWYDGRRDIVASTKAALDYLTYLNKRFDGDWLLALAAYNSGEGTVARAVRSNQKSGKPDDYWHLKLPRETQRYIPKLLSIARLVANPTKYGAELPKLPNKPYFTAVNTDGQIELSKAAALAGIGLDELEALNPGFSRWATAPDGPYRLLLPVDSSDRFQLALSSLPRSERVRWTRYKIHRGDTLSGIAHHFHTEVSVIRKSNKLPNNRIRAGHTLLIPSPLQQSGSELASASGNRKGDRIVHRVSSGDSLWKIAHQYGVSTEQLADWNQIDDASTLRPGQDLILYPGAHDPG